MAKKDLKHNHVPFAFHDAPILSGFSSFAKQNGCGKAAMLG
jgi:hypothetical protein